MSGKLNLCQEVSAIYTSQWQAACYKDTIWLWKWTASNQVWRAQQITTSHLA